MHGVKMSQSLPLEHILSLVQESPFGDLPGEQQWALAKAFRERVGRDHGLPLSRSFTWSDFSRHFRAAAKEAGLGAETARLILREARPQQSPA